MSITVKATYQEVKDIRETFSKVSQAMPCEHDTDIEEFQKTMYSCGRNYNVAHAIITKVEARILKMKMDYEDAELRTYDEERLAINILHCEKDSAGEPVTKVDPQGAERFSIPHSFRKALASDIKNLDAKYAEAIERIKANDKKADDIMNDEVEIEIRTRPWKFVPKAITGAWLDKLTVMLTDIPDID